jgi:hypothetical protein
MRASDLRSMAASPAIQDGRGCVPQRRAAPKAERVLPDKVALPSCREGCVGIAFWCAAEAKSRIVRRGKSRLKAFVKQRQTRLPPPRKPHDQPAELTRWMLSQYTPFFLFHIQACRCLDFFTLSFVARKFPDGFTMMQRQDDGHCMVSTLDRSSAQLLTCSNPRAPKLFRLKCLVRDS